MTAKVYDGLVERSVSVTGDEEAGDVHIYRAVESLLPTAGLMRSPCGACPVHRDLSYKTSATVSDPPTPLYRADLVVLDWVG